ncbi:PREDICTED: BPI fold-containing family B member 3 [Hipposideros armiger]|uniref:BPI fold-containing family B member 3 n=1 Tax=Hipposideros armiger TaxID=186990 RepID=A0A8B7RPY3_HIPAR|nr:PREDICTED: BPI fold-containing family B member 3 [Hipposideros armiger]
METGDIQSSQCPPCPSPMLALSLGGSCTLMLLTLPRLLPPQLFGVVEQTLFKVLPELLCPMVDSVLCVVNELLGAVLTIQNSLIEGPILQNVLGTVTSVNQGLLGSRGLLGGGGLLGYGGVFGVIEELSGLKIEELTLPKVSLKLLPGFGVQLKLHTKVRLHGSGSSSRDSHPTVLPWIPPLYPFPETSIPLTPKDFHLMFPGDTYSIAWSSLEGLGEEGSCCGHIRAAPSPERVEELTGGCEPPPTCRGAAGVGLVPLGALGTVEFSLATLPLTSNQYIELDINPIVKSLAGDVIDFPKPHKPVKVPPKEDHTSQVTVPLFLFNTVFGLLQTNSALNIDITPELVPSNVPLTTTDLAALVPEVLVKLPPGQQLLLSLRVKEVPTVTLQSKKATVSIPAVIHVLSYLPAGTPEALFELNGVMTLSAQLSPSATKLHLSLSLERLSVKQASFAHAFDVSSWEGEWLGGGEGLQVGVERSCVLKHGASHLEEWLSDVVRAAYVPKLNADLDVGIPLPKVLNVNFAKASLEIIEVSF